MNKRLRNNALLHLAKCTHALILNSIIFIIFIAAIDSNHHLLGFIVFVIFTVITAISLIQLTLFVKNMKKANKK